ncbi:MAG TPA: DUF302 domain-containing protein [Blastocatellia bacterium]|nr:DUF302 domain-containing protein [Blastocatellia bacterium]
MPTRRIDVERFTLISSKPFKDVLAALDEAVGHPDMNAFRKSVGAATTFSELERVIQPAIGPAGFMEFIRFDHGEVVYKGETAEAPGIMRLVIGNPLIMKQMVQHLPDAGSYAPVTILVDQRPDGVHLSYDRVASLLGPYGNMEASKVARELDSKVEALLASAAG